MLSGENDEVIPPVHMHQLWKAACGPQKNSAGPPGLKKRNTKDGKSPDSTPNANTKESLTEEQKELLQLECETVGKSWQVSHIKRTLWRR